MDYLPHTTGSLVISLLWYDHEMSRIMIKPVYAICEQQRPVIVRCLDRIITFVIPLVANFRISILLSSLCSWAGRFESYLVANTKDMFFHGVAQILIVAYCQYAYLAKILLLVCWAFYLFKVQLRIEVSPSICPFLKNNGDEAAKGPSPIIFQEWTDTRTFFNLKYASFW